MTHRHLTEARKEELRKIAQVGALLTSLCMYVLKWQLQLVAVCT
jgi:hypothetical protein